MSRVVGTLRYVFEDAWDAWRHAPGPALLSTATVSAVLFVAGLVLLVETNLAGSLARWSDEVRIDVFLRDDAGTPERDAIRAKLDSLAGVARTELVDKDEALRRFRAAFRSLGDLPGEIGENPLPASIEVYPSGEFSAAATAKLVATAVGDAPGVEEVRFDREVLERVESALRLARLGGSALGALVLASVVVVVAGVQRLSVYSRRDEIDVMLLVGASPSFVRGPFLAAGLAEGLAGSVVAVGLVEAVRRAALSQTAAEPAAIVEVALGRPLPWAQAGLLAAAGALVGLLSAWFAVRHQSKTM